MAIQYIPRQRSPWEQALPGFLQNLIFQQMGAKRQQQRFAQQQKAKQEEEIRAYKAKGWRETGTAANAIQVGETYLAPPETSIEYRRKEVGGQEVLSPVILRTPQGGKPQVVSVGGAIKSASPAKPGKIWMHNPKTKVKRQVTPDKVGGLLKAGWTEGQPYGPQGGGTSLTVGPDGQIRFVQGGVEQGLTPVGELTTSQKGKSQEAIKTLEGRKSLLQETMRKYNPTYSTWLTRATMWTRGLREKAQGMPGVKPLDPKEKQEFGEFVDWRTSSLEDFGKVIHEMAGATLTPREEKIYGAFIQNASKDSPTEYITKLKQNYTSLNKALARENYYLNIQGMPQAQYEKLRKQNKLSMVEFDRAVDAKYAEYVSRLRAEDPNKPWEKIKEEAKGMIRASFFGF